jgi:ABC-type polysaccharide/polyol phosphate transport system ATPase subunit
MMRRCATGARRSAAVSPDGRQRGDAPPSTIAYRGHVSLALRVRTLWKSYAAGVEGCSARAWILRGASLEVAQGECVAVLGAPGAGTTTLLYCLAGLLRPDAGSVETHLDPLLVQSHRMNEERECTGHLLLVDDGLRLRHDGERARLIRARADRPPTSIIATHELSRVRDIADRFLLLHHGRLLPLDRLTGLRRVAEPAASEHR